MPKAMSGSGVSPRPARLCALLPPTLRSKPLVLSLLLLLGILALLVLAPSDAARAHHQDPPGHSGPDPAPPSEHRVPVNWPLIPSGLGPGDSFRLMFLTTGKSRATSGNINDYINFVQNEANAGHSGIKPYAHDFRPVLSTDGPSNIHARSVISYTMDHSSDGPGRVPVYWLNGSKVADNSDDFFDNSWDSHDARNRTAGHMWNLTLEHKRAWTGSNDRGWRNYAAGRNGDVRTGLLRTRDELEHDTKPGTDSYRFYVMSPVFTVDRTKARATFAVVENLYQHCELGRYA